MRITVARSLTLVSLLSLSSLLGTGCFGSASSSSSGAPVQVDPTNPDKAVPTLESRLRRDPDDLEALKAPEHIPRKHSSHQ